MIEKKEESADNNSDTTRIKIITEKIKSLDENVSKVRTQVTICFEDLKNSLMAREKQLLRQIEAIHNQQLSILQSDWELVNSIPGIAVDLVNDSKNLSESIVKFGKLEFIDNKDNFIIKNIEPYSIHEYEDDNKDHITFDKSLQIDDNDENVTIKFSNITFSNRSSISDNSNTGILNTNLKTKVNFDSKLLLLSSDNNNEIDNEENCSSMCSNTDADIIKDSKSDSIEKKITNNQTINSSLDLYSELQIASNNHVPQQTIIHNQYNITDFTNKTNNNNNNIENDKQMTDEHPKQIQQWLQQILIESETEPSIQEIDHFTDEILKFRCTESLLET
ncbi:probable serine/threonine-protein kinase DDB_G0283337 [Microplitis mediator]|uniref:probable serine/threonine-protein kinase DDB_G0283337 n=1 Tax=Microplitis mediator TaxID=375433 RepID=UPI002555DA03|nr:probable serine/threonine-protein kinase DDB_G0283337 [Microplitis mediator]